MSRPDRREEERSVAGGHVGGRFAFIQGRISPSDSSEASRVGSCCVVATDRDPLSFGGDWGSGDACRAAPTGGCRKILSANPITVLSRVRLTASSSPPACAASREVTGAFFASPSATIGRRATESERFSPLLYGEPLKEKVGQRTATAAVGEQDSRGKLHEDRRVLLREGVRVRSGICTDRSSVSLIIGHGST